MIVAKVHRQYTKSLFRALNWRGTWPVSERLELGDVGTLEDGIFRQETTLADLRVSFSKNWGTARTSFYYESSSGVSVHTKLAGETSRFFSYVGHARAGVSFLFSRAGAVVFWAPSCRVGAIANPASLRPKLKRLRESGDWDRDWVFISRVIKAPRATILVSGSRGAGVELRADQSVTAIDLAKIGADLAVARREGMAVFMVAAGDLIPLYQVRNVTR